MLIVVYHMFHMSVSALVQEAIYIPAERSKVRLTDKRGLCCMWRTTLYHEIVTKLIFFLNHSGVLLLKTYDV